MNTRSLRTFLRIAQLGSFAKVADELHTSVSTVSMQVKTLEDELGAQLFDRNFRPPQLTPVGRQVLDQTHHLLNAEKGILDICSSGTELTGVYRIGFVATASVRILPHFLANVRDHAPEARFEIETALSEALEARVSSGHLDMAVVTESDAAKSGLSYHLLREEEMVFAFPEGYDRKTVADTRLPFLQFNPGSGIGKLIEERRLREGLAVNQNVIVLESVEAIMACVNQGLGFTILAEADVRLYASQSAVIAPVSGQKLSRRLSLAISQARVHSKEVNYLKNLFD